MAVDTDGLGNDSSLLFYEATSWNGRSQHVLGNLSLSKGNMTRRKGTKIQDKEEMKVVSDKAEGDNGGQESADENSEYSGATGGDSNGNMNHGYCGICEGTAADQMLG
ncbi:hypothetical protein SK128_024499 [Halocaridina rubra]|uniref:Uncharacterized protein n=1 Tax=Halocaridina rubra TaxID=373956 RepID=A0AAN9A696_HALRR